MRVDELLGEAPVAFADVADRVVVVIDVRCAATIVDMAPSCGARAVTPFGTIEETVMRGKAYARGEVLPKGGDLTIIGLGHEKRLALEDAIWAGRRVRGIGHGREDAPRGDGARVADLVERSSARGVVRVAHEATPTQSLGAAGFSDDVQACLSLDRFDVAVCDADRLRRHARVAAVR